MLRSPNICISTILSKAPYAFGLSPESRTERSPEYSQVVLLEALVLEDAILRTIGVGVSDTIQKALDESLAEAYVNIGIAYGRHDGRELARVTRKFYNNQAISLMANSGSGRAI